MMKRTLFAAAILALTISAFGQGRKTSDYPHDAAPSTNDLVLVAVPLGVSVPAAAGGGTNTQMRLDEWQYYMANSIFMRAAQVAFSNNLAGSLSAGQLAAAIAAGGQIGQVTSNALAGQIAGGSQSTTTTNLSQLANFSFPMASTPGFYASMALRAKQATTWVDYFNNLTNWTVVNTTNVQVSTNRLFRGTQLYADGSAAFAMREFVILSNQTARVRFKIAVPTNAISGTGTNGLVLVGFNEFQVGAPAPNDNTIWGVGIQVNVVNSRNAYGFCYKLNSSYTDLNYPCIPGHVYTGDISVDVSNVSMVIHGDTDPAFGFTNEPVRINFPRVAPISCISNITIVNADLAGLSGLSVNVIGARKSLAGIVPRAGIEDTNFTISTLGPFGQLIRVCLPTEYNGDPLPAIYYSSPDAGDMFDRGSPPQPYWQKMLNAGFMLVGVTCTSPTFSNPNQPAPYGNAAMVTNVVNGLRFVQSQFPVSGWVFEGESRGGFDVDNVLAASRGNGINPLVVIKRYPVESIAETFVNTSVSNDFFAAYGVTLGNYAALTNALLGRDPVNSIEAARMAVPQRIYQSPADTTVLGITNVYLLQSKMTNGFGWCPFELVVTSGAHGDATNYQSDQDLDFIYRMTGIRKPAAVQDDGNRTFEYSPTFTGPMASASVATSATNYLSGTASGGATNTLGYDAEASVSGVGLIIVKRLANGVSVWTNSYPTNAVFNLRSGQGFQINAGSSITWKIE